MCRLTINWTIELIRQIIFTVEDSIYINLEKLREISHSILKMWIIKLIFNRINMKKILHLKFCITKSGVHIFLFLIFYLFLGRGEGKEKERDRNISVWLPLKGSLLETWPDTQACAVTGNWTGNPLGHRLALDPLNHTSQGVMYTLFIYMEHLQNLTSY